MKDRVLLDTGPLVAFLDRRENAHRWVSEAFRQLRLPLFTNEVVVSEALFLLRHLPEAIDEIGQWIGKGYLRLPFRLETEAEEVFKLIVKYRNLPMSLADACLVRMLEMNLGDRILTLDGHFRIYRQRNRRAIPVLMPE